MSTNIQTIRRYEDELYQLRELVLELMSPEIRQVLDPWSKTSSVTEWRLRAAEAVIRLAEPKSPADMGSTGLSDRACCPLCREGRADSFGSGEIGFAYPGGLRRHLLGIGNSRPCRVLRAIADIVKTINSPGPQLRLPPQE